MCLYAASLQGAHSRAPFWRNRRAALGALARRGGLPAQGFSPGLPCSVYKLCWDLSSFLSCVSCVNQVAFLVRKNSALYRAR